MCLFEDQPIHSWIALTIQSISLSPKYQPIPYHHTPQTPENKPTSVTTIISFATPEAVKALFGSALKETVEVSFWRKRNFQKSYKADSGEASFLRVGEPSIRVRILGGGAAIALRALFTTPSHLI